MAKTQLRFDIAQHYPVTTYSLPLFLWDVVDNAWTKKGVKFTQEHPTTDVKGPTIVWSVYRRVPGKEGVESLKPRRRGDFPTEDPTVTLEQYAQWQTILYQFDIYDVNNQGANNLLEEFEELMFHITPKLQELGVSEWLFDEQLRDLEVGAQNSQDVYRRTLRYRCILEKKIIKATPNIQAIWLQSAIDHPHRVDNEQIVRGGTSKKDLLANRWVTGTFLVDRVPYLNLTLAPSGQEFIEGIDYFIDTTLPSGRSYIEWIPKGKHPMPGEVYYATYYHHQMSTKTPIK